MKKVFLPEKKTFRLFKSLFFHKNGKAQNMPLVAGRVVKVPIQGTKLQRFC